MPRAVYTVSRMGFMRRAVEWLSTAPTATFAEEQPRPIDQIIVEMMAQGGAALRVGRTEALSVPAIQRGRNLICSISTLPLMQFGPENTVKQHPLFEQIDPNVPNVVVLAMTIEDLLFEQVAWWRVTDIGFDEYPIHAERIDPIKVVVQPGGRVYIDGKYVPNERLIRFDSPNPGLLKTAARAIRRALLLDQAAAMYADEPRPLDYFTPSEGADPASDDDVKDVLTKWKLARKQRGTAYVPAALKYNSVDQPTPADLQLVELQRRVTLDIANALGLDPEDLGLSTTSRTYQNATDRRQDRINDTLSPYMRAITDRLSMGDVTKRGYRVAFDLDDYMRADPRTRWDVYKTAWEMDAITVEEIRNEEKMSRKPAGAQRAVPTQRPAQRALPGVAASHDTFSGMNFADDQSGMIFADVPSASFSVDENARTITGLAVPYNKVATNMFRKWRFEKGSLQFSDLGRVKLLRDHDRSQAVGRAIELTDTPLGVVMKFRVARGPEGDRVLALAADGVLDGLSIGVDFDLQADTIPDPDNKGVTLVRRADLREVSLTAMPAFDDSRVTSVAASRDKGTNMPDNPTIEPQAPTAPAGAPDMSAMFSTWMAQQVQAAQVAPAQPAHQGPTAPTPVSAVMSGLPLANETRQVVNPTHVTASVTDEALPYRFDRGGNFLPTDHVFSADLHAMKQANDLEGTETDAGKRVMGLLQAAFATTTTGNVTDLNPTIQRPDMYVDQKDYRTPLWDMVSKGAPPNGVNPFRFPKFSSTSPTNLVADHTEGVEPTSGNFTATGQTVTPTALSGKASLPREVWDMGGNPAVSTLVFNQMKRGYREGLESATATFLNTLTAATDILITTGAVNAALAGAWDAALAELQFIRGYDFSAFAIEKELYKVFVAAADTAGRKLFPIINPQNANGTAASRFRTLDLSGVIGVPSWALPSTLAVPNNSWLFDPSTVHGWASAPQRLEFPGTAAAGTYAPVAMVDIAIWGYKAFANSDIGGVRQVIYDTV